MKRILTTIAILLTTTSVVAGEQEKRAVKAIETVLEMKVKEAVKPYVKVAAKKIIKKIENKMSGKSDIEKAGAAGLAELIRKGLQPQYTHETGKSVTTYTVIKHETLKIDYKSKKSDLKFNFETNGKKTKFGLGMSF